MKKLLLIFLAVYAFDVWAQNGTIANDGNTIKYSESGTLLRTMDKQGLSLVNYGASDDKIRFYQTNKNIFEIRFSEIVSPDTNNVTSLLNIISSWLASYSVDSSLYADTSAYADNAGGLLGLSYHSLLTDTILGVENGIIKMVPKPTGSGSVGNADSLNGQTPAYYLSRTNHTGAQDTSTITSLNAYLNLKLNISDTSNLWQTNGNSTTFPNNVIGTKSNADVVFKASNIEAFRIDSLRRTVIIAGSQDSLSTTTKLRIGNQKTGIATTNPQYSSGGVAQINYSGTTTTQSGLIITNTNTSGTTASATLSMGSNDGAGQGSGDWLANIDFFGQRSSSVNMAGARLTALTNQAWATGQNGSIIKMSTCQTNGSTLLDRLLLNDGKIGLGNGTNAAPTTPTYIFSWNGNASFTLGGERHTTAGTAGNSGTLYLGSGATSGATDKDAGNAVLSCGQYATGNGGGSVEFQTIATGQGAGTTDRTPTTKVKVMDNGKLQALYGYASSLIDNLTSATADTLFSIPLVADSTFNCSMTYGIKATDGDTTQSESGVMLISAVNDDGTLQYSFTTLGSTQPTGILGTLSKTLSCSLASNVLYVIVNVTSSISPTSMNIRVTPDLHTSYVLTKL